jgi:TatD DNase family protein
MSKKKKTKRPEPESLGLLHVGVETHAHLDMDEFAEDLDQVLERAAKSGVAHIGQVFLGPAVYGKNRALFNGRKGFFFILGVHPHDATSLDQAALDAMRQAFADDPELKAVGEIGLDYYYDYSPREVQRQAFRDQLRLARNVDKPVVVHSRDARDETMAILEEEGFGGRPLLWHCFGHGADFAAKVAGRGWLMSIPGTVTFKKSDVLREAVAATPIEHLVIETDCPYMAPEPYRGKRNEPAFCVFTAQEVARVKGMDVQDVWRITADNAKKFFGLG